MTEPDLGTAMNYLATYAPELVPYVLLAAIAFGKIRGIHRAVEKLLTIDTRIEQIDKCLEQMDRSLKELATETRGQFTHIRQDLVNLDSRVSRIEGRHAAALHSAAESRSSWVMGDHLPQGAKTP